VAHPIPQATTAGPLERAYHCEKGPRGLSPDVPEVESDEGTNMDAYLNMTLFMTQPIRIFLLLI
jgi:hypothetical protein